MAAIKNQHCQKTTYTTSKYTADPKRVYKAVQKQCTEQKILKSNKKQHLMFTKVRIYKLIHIANIIFYIDFKKTEIISLKSLELQPDLSRINQKIQVVHKLHFFQAGYFLCHPV